MKNINWLLAGAVLSCAACLATPRPLARALPQECGHALNADLAVWNFDSAVARVNRCIKQRRADLEALRKAETEKKISAGEQLLEVKGAIAHLLCVKTQVLALKGALPEAQQTLKYAELFNRAYPEAGMDLAVNNSLLPITRAFVLEKSGDLKGAAEAYKDIVAATRAAGFSAYPDSLCGRLAVIAFETGDDKAAARWSRETASYDSAAKAVQGAMQQKLGDAPGAKDNYEAALKLLEAAANSEAAVLPIYFAEQEHIKDGLSEVAK